MAVTKEIIITGNSKGAVDAISAVDQESKKATGSIDNVKKAVDGATGGALGKFQSMQQGIKGVTSGFGALKGAIIATGLGALLIIVTSLIEYFKNFEGGVKIVTTITNLFGDTIAAIVDNASKLLSLDFAGFFGGVKDAMVESVNATNDLFAAEEKLYELNKKFIVENATLNAEIERQGRIVRDTTKTFDERLSAQKELDRLSEKLIQNEKDLNDAELVRLKTELRLENNYEKRRDLEIQIEQTMANLIAVESKMAAQRDKASKAQRQIEEEQENIEKDRIAKAQERAKKAAEERKRQLEKEQAEKQKRIEAEIKKEEDRQKAILSLNEQYKKKIEDLEDTTELQKLARAESRALLELEKLNATEEEKLNLRTYYAQLNVDAQKKIDDKEAEDRKAFLLKQAEEQSALQEMELNAKRAFEDAKFGIANQGLNLMGSLAGKSKAIATTMLLIEKGLAVSQVITNASRAIAQAQANLAATPAVIGVVPNPAYAIQAAATLKGIATTKISAGLAIGNILAQTIGSLSKGGNLGGDSSGGGGGQVPTAPSFNLVQGTGSNQIAESLQSQNRPIQAYVVASEVTTQQSLERNIVSNSSL
jgi:chemotaxis protein histidine kinase CheA